MPDDLFNPPISPFLLPTSPTTLQTPPFLLLGHLCPVPQIIFAENISYCSISMHRWKSNKYVIIHQTADRGAFYHHNFTT